MNKGYLFLAASMALVGSNITLGKIILQEMSVFTFSLIRFFLVAAVFSWGFRTHLKEFINLSPSDRWKLFAMAAVGFFGFTLFMLLGLKLTTALEAGLLTSLIPLMGVLFSVVFLKESLNPRIYFSLIFALLGVVFLNLNSEMKWNFQFDSLLGQGLVLLGVACEGAYVVFARKFSQSLSKQGMTFWMSFFSATLFMPLCLYQVLNNELEVISISLLVKIIIYSVFGSVLAVQLWLLGAKKIEAHKASLMTAMVPVFAGGSAVIILKEELSLRFFIAAGLIFIALVNVIFEKTKQKN